MIIVKNLTKNYVFKTKLKGKIFKKKAIKNAVNDISFKVDRGDIVGYIGLNGAGKSTSIKMLCGILRPTDGTIMINGLDPYKNRILNSRQIGVVFGQRTQLWWDLPLKDSFKVLKEIYNISDKDYSERLSFFNHIFEIYSLLDSNVRTLSLGERMKADITASLLHNPEILFLDEPTIGLDVISKLNMRRAIKEINERYNTTILLTTHDLKDVEELCDNIILLNNGKIMFDDKIDNFYLKYGKKKRIEILTGHSSVAEDLYRKFMVKFQNIESSLDKNKVVVSFIKEKKVMDSILSFINNFSGIIDYKVNDEGLEDIIRNHLMTEEKSKNDQII